MISIFTHEQKLELISSAEINKRRRAHFNLHQAYSDPVQRTIIAMCHDSYVRPHKHISDPKIETLVLIEGVLGVVLFEENSEIFETHKMESICTNVVEIPPTVNHTAICLSETCVFLECKEGPYDAQCAKDFCSWAPSEGSAASKLFLNNLKKLF